MHDTFVAAVVLARSGNTATLQTALNSISCVVDVIVLVPKDGSEGPDLQGLAASMPCQVDFYHHNVTWSNSLSKAQNAALAIAGIAAGKQAGDT